jgi:hypothetical protein
MSENLNSLPIPDDGPQEHWKQTTNLSCWSPSARVDVIFRELRNELVKRINGSDFVVGCVAWLTDSTILEALCSVPKGVSIVVQKEDFLRPDLGAGGSWKTRLRELYSKLPMLPERYGLGGLASKLSYACDPTLQSVRCVGNHNSEKKPVFPRMHNKYLVFGSLDDSEWPPKITPESVWTGSFNLTRNASMSFENAVVIHDVNIATAYYGEWEQILALSEKLDWTVNWCAPEWRIGS